MARRKKRTRRKRSHNSRSLAGSASRVVLLCLVLAIVAGGYWLFRLDRTLVARFEGQKWAVPAHVYSRPQELYPGLKLDRNEFVDKLDKLGYRQVEKLDRQASYAPGPATVSLVSRPYTLWDQNLPGMAIRVEFGEQRIRSIINLRDSAALSRFSLEPELIGSLRPGQHEDRDLISISDVPPEFIKTLLATEDRKFLNHHGVDFFGIARAMVANLRAGKVVQGGSTITQQLVKNYYLTSDRTYRRKIKEIIMALLLELHYDKHEILETYINEVYLGQAGNRAIHGFELASKFYFGRPMRELDSHESALLVGLIKGPSYYNPLRNPQRAKQRRDVIIDLMQLEGVIGAGKAASMKQRPLGVKENTLVRHNVYPAYLDLVRRQLSRHYDEDLLLNEGLSIYTALDPGVQQATEKALTRVIGEIEAGRSMKSGTLQGAAVVLKASSGEILALASDRDGGYVGFNRALDAKRPIGSLVKPAVYLTAFEHSRDYTLITGISDSPLTIVDPDTGVEWTPGNYDREYHGNVLLVDALAKSYNIPAVRVGMDVGVEPVIDTMRHLGLVSPIGPYPSTLLGASQHTPLEVAQMFQTIANDGYKSPLRAILNIQTSANQPVERYPLKVRQVVRAASAYLVEFGLKQAVKIGTARTLDSRFPADYGIAGKTGTTNDYRDSWFAGYSGDLVAIVWLGRDDNKSTGLTGASGALKVWAELFSQLRLQQWPDTPPPDVRFVSVNKLTGLETEPDCELAFSVPFIDGTEPHDFQSCNQLVDTHENEGPGASANISQTLGEAAGGVKDWFQTLFGKSESRKPVTNPVTSER